MKILFSVTTILLLSLPLSAQDDIAVTLHYIEKIRKSDQLIAEELEKVYWFNLYAE